MSTRYGYIWRREWRDADRGFRGLTKDEKIVLFGLRTGPISTALPGLVEGDALMLASVTELTPGEAEAALAGLVAKRRIALDPERCLIRIAGLPDPEEPPAPVRSYKTLAGWFALWQELPDSPLKYDHIASLRAACDLDVVPKDGNPSMADTWAQTFGSVTRPSDTPSDTPIRGASDTRSDASVQRTAYSGQQTADSGREKNTAADAAPAAPTGAPVPLALVPAEAGSTSDTSRRATKGRKRTPRPVLLAPLPDLLAAIRDGSAGRVKVGYDWRQTGKLEKALAGLTVEDGRLLGESLAAGVGDGWRGDLDARWIAKVGNVAAQLQHARTWVAEGRPVQTKRNGVASRGVAPSANWSDAVPGVER